MFLVSLIYRALSPLQLLCIQDSCIQLISEIGITGGIIIKIIVIIIIKHNIPQREKNHLEVACMEHSSVSCEITAHAADNQNFPPSVGCGFIIF